MTLEEATALAQKQADEARVVMIVVKDDLSEDAGGYECCAEIYRDILYPDHHRQFWEIVGRVVPGPGERCWPGQEAGAGPVRSERDCVEREAGGLTI